jgi:Glycosyl hydrolases family 28
MLKKTIIPVCLIILGTFLFIKLPGQTKANKVTIYPAPAGITLSRDFKVSVEGKDVPVYMARVARVDQRLKEISESYFDTASFAYFDLAEPVTVTVNFPSKINTAKILPAVSGIIPKIIGNSLSFSINVPKNLTIEINGDIVSSLHIFANPPEKDVPSPADSNVVFFGPGIHEVSQMTIGDNKTLYVAGGAYVRALISPEEKSSGRRNLPPTFTIRGKNITVRGRGIIDATFCPTRSRNMFMVRGKDVKIEGVILLDGSPWFMPVRQSENVSIDNIKIIGYRGNSDCIDIANCRNVTVEKCFLRSSDDLIVIKSDRNQGKVNHIIARDCVLWNQFAHALSIGAELREDIDDVLFTNCDVIHDTGREWALRIFHCDSSRVTNVRFENIRIEDSRRLISLWIGKSVWSLDKEQRGWIDGVVFKDIKASGSPLTIAFVGFDDKHGISNILFQNVLLNGKPLRNDDLQMNTFVKNISIKP